ncbi:2136_t:CDS:2, partial [Gigaspora rosea]
TPLVLASAIPVLNEQMEQMVSLMKEGGLTDLQPVLQGHYSQNCPNLYCMLAQNNEQVLSTIPQSKTIENQEATKNMRPILKRW